MNMKRWIILPAMAFALVTTPALADGHKGGGEKGPGKMLEKADSNGDGAVSRQEFLDAHAVKFDEIDSDGDGSITEDDVKAHMEAKRAEKKDEWFEKMDADGSGEVSKEEMEAHRDSMKDKRQDRRDTKKSEE